jgi:hypothetical protein
MKYLTYRDLKNWLQNLTDEQLGMTATVYDSDLNEFYPVTTSYLSDTEDILGSINHPVLEIKGDETN